MAVWAILAAPLFMSTDLDTIRPEFSEILLNKNIIKINQDLMGIQGRRICKVRSVKGESNLEARKTEKAAGCITPLARTPRLVNPQTSGPSPLTIFSGTYVLRSRIV